MSQTSYSNFYERGVTLVEIVAVVFMIALFSTILIADFPKIQRQFTLSRTAYNLAQSLRKAQDLGLSGIRMNDSNANQIPAKGYGVFIDKTADPTQYIIYADIGTIVSAADQKFNSTNIKCSGQSNFTTDCIVEIINVTKENSELYIKEIKGESGVSYSAYVSVNFSPPDPIVNIDPASAKVGIVLGLTSDDSSTRTVWVNKSGLISVE